MDSEGKEKPLKKKRDTQALRLRGKFYGAIKEDTGHHPTPSVADYLQVKKAIDALGEEATEEMFEEARRGNGVRTVRGVFTNRAIDIYAQDNL